MVVGSSDDEGGNSYKDGDNGVNGYNYDNGEGKCGSS